MVPKIALYPQGLQLSRLVFGAWRLAEWQLTTPDLITLIEQCLALGITTIDHADIYGGYTCEALFGAALRQAPALRSQLQLVTKCGIKLISPQRPDHKIKSYDTSQAHIFTSVENSLRNLGTDYLDVLLLHRPDPFMNADDTAEALQAVVNAGKVRAVGVSNFTPSQFDLLQSRLALPLVTNQIEISVLRLDPFLDGTLDQAQRLRRAPMAWSPLGGGGLFTSDAPQAQRVRAALTTIKNQVNAASEDQVALAWLLAHPANIIPVLGTGKIARVQAAAEALALTLTREQWFAIWEASAGQEVP